jgi:hypothetical protein
VYVATEASSALLGSLRDEAVVARESTPLGLERLVVAQHLPEQRLLAGALLCAGEEYVDTAAVREMPAYDVL